MKMNLKHSVNYVILAILSFVLLASLVLTPLSSAFISGVSPVSGMNYAIFEGTAGNDYYDSMQYSYLINQWANANLGTATQTPASVWFNASDGLRIGMDEYGEFATPKDAGIAYGSNYEMWNLTESWASSDVYPGYWVQGWVLAVNYTTAAVQRSLEAYALYSNFSGTKSELGRGCYSWYWPYAPGSVNSYIMTGQLMPTGVQVLYDSARLAIARTNVIVWDPYVNAAFAQVTFTLVFNKDMKYATVYKDVKILLDPKVLDSIQDFCFSERYEIDLARGLNYGNKAYVYYDANYGTTYYTHPLTLTNTYDVLQAYDPNHQFIFFAGYWPNATEYSVYTTLVPNLYRNPMNTTVLPIGTHLADFPTPPGAPATPWVVVQWRFDSSNPKWTALLQWLTSTNTPTNEREIRFVEVVGMTNFHQVGTTIPIFPHPATNPQDHNATYAHPFELDTEVAYLLGSVFNPPDLFGLAGGYSYADTYTSDNFMWIGLGQSSATTDSAGASFISGILGFEGDQPFALFDRNDTMFPWTAPVVGMSGSIPYGLSSFSGKYYQTFSNLKDGTGQDCTTYLRTTLNGFAWGVYDNETLCPPQPIAGGWAENYSLWAGYPANLWYPSMNPLTGRWLCTGNPLKPGSWTPDPYYTAPPTQVNGIVTMGGEKANGLTRYFNDFDYAITREGTTDDALLRGGTVTGKAPTSNGSLPTLDYFPVSSWATNQTTFGYLQNYAVISLAYDVNGTRGLSIYGANGRDTYWAAAWASQYILTPANHAWIPRGTVAIILHITYNDAMEPTMFTVVQALGTITQFGVNDFEVGQGITTWPGTIQSNPSLYGYIPAYPTSKVVWWWAKLPTDSTAKVQFDP
jgi:hypothetical protein